MDGSTQQVSGNAVHLRNAAIYAALDGVASNLPTVTQHLQTQGLTDPSCAVAYRAALHATRNAELAWDGAREQQLLVLRQQQVAEPARFDELGERIRYVAELANPFAYGMGALGAAA